MWRGFFGLRRFGSSMNYCKPALPSLCIAFPHLSAVQNGAPLSKGHGRARNPVICSQGTWGACSAHALHLPASPSPTQQTRQPGQWAFIMEKLQPAHLALDSNCLGLRTTNAGLGKYGVRWRQPAVVCLKSAGGQKLLFTTTFAFIPWRSS